MSDELDRDFGAADTRTWDLPGLWDEITRQTVDALEHATADEAPALLAVLLDLARLRAAPTTSDEGN